MSQPEYLGTPRIPAWITISIVIFLSVLVYRVVEPEYVNFFPEKSVTAKVTKFELDRSKDSVHSGFYMIRYEYFVDGKKYIGGENDWFNQPDPKFKAGSKITVNLRKDANGSYIAMIPNLLEYILVGGWLLAILIVLIMYFSNYGFFSAQHKR